MIPSKHEHRPWPIPAQRWSIYMRWHQLLFMHWPIPIAALRPLVPVGLELDTFDGQAWIGVVPFRMSGIRKCFLPPVPGPDAFPELNVRTYVTMGGRPGVWFFSLDAASRLAVRMARWSFNLPYFDARMQCRADVMHPGGADYVSRRVHRGAPPAEFAARYRPTGPVFQASPGTLDYFLTERYCLYAERRGTLYRGEIAHHPWPLQPAEAEVSYNRMVEPLGVSLPDINPLLHYADHLSVIAWNLKSVG